jgi:HEAT repeat protein
MLQDQEPVVRTSVARELQMRGGAAVWRIAKDLCKSKKTQDRVIGIFLISQLGTPRLPYQQESLDLINSLLSHERSSEVIEECLYAIGHLRKGKPLGNENLVQRIKGMKARPGSSLSAAKAFAVRKY